MAQVLLPKDLEVERVADQSSGSTVRFYSVRGGVCDYCGVIDANQPSEVQYKLCRHYKGKQLSCSYCPAGKNQNEVIRNSTLTIMQNPDFPNRMIIHCDSFDCLKAHRERWQLSGR